MNYPYVNYPYGVYRDNAMHMIRHNHKCIQFNFITNVGGFHPLLRYHPSGIIRHHFPIQNMPEQTLPVLRCKW